MKFTLSWLKDHLDTQRTAAELASKLSAIGLDVESLEDPGAALAPFTIARIAAAKPHPNAQKLKVCAVETGSGLVEVVCGAPNAMSGLVGVFAPVGSYIPGTEVTLAARPVRGVVSNGMLLSERELKLSDNDEGIIELGAEYASRIGERYAAALGLDDPVFTVKLTPNRPDCTAVRGIARDLAAAGMGRLKPEREVARIEGRFPCPVDIRLDFPAAAADACPCFAGRYLKGVSNGPSPPWMQRRLRAAGLRPINALVDVTNYITLDRGRPLHVYDADKLSGAVSARLGREGEQFEGLDGKTHRVDGTMCVIADAKGVLGLGGILGGERTACTHETKNVLIECAYFDPLRTAATGRKTGIESDARYRFERGVDPTAILPGLEVATVMMIEVAGGTPSEARIAGAPPARGGAIDFPLAMVQRLAGVVLPPARIIAILTALGFAVEGQGERVRVTAPGWRPDVHGAADLVEEVVRIHGLDSVPAAAMQRLSGVARPVLTARQRRVRRARRLLAGRGMVEAIGWSFIAHEAARRFGGGHASLELANPISSELTTMRPSLLPGLLAAAARNRNRGVGALAMFEVGQAYRGDQPQDQFLLASGVRLGRATLAGTGRHWSGTAAPAGVFDAKADAFALFSALGFEARRGELVRQAPPWFHPGRSGSLRLGPKTVLAHFGELHPDALALWELDAPVAAFEVFIDALPEPKPALARASLEALDLLPVRRDFAFVVDKAVAAGDVAKAAERADKIIRSVSIFDVFEGGGVGEGKKSVAIEVTLQPVEKTLTEEEIDAVARRILTAVKSTTGGFIRS